MPAHIHLDKRRPSSPGQCPQVKSRQHARVQRRRAPSNAHLRRELHSLAQVQARAVKVVNAQRVLGGLIQRRSVHALRARRKQALAVVRRSAQVAECQRRECATLLER